MSGPYPKDSIYIVIPAFNEGAVIKDVIGELRRAGYDHIIVIDDGSADSTFTVARDEGVTALRHAINRGKGAAIKTGFEAAKLLGAGIVVTVDGDGQHDPGDIERLVAAIMDGNDVVLGARRFNRDGMPAVKVLYNRLGNLVIWIIFGFRALDSQCGLRAYSRRAVQMIDTKNDRYEYDSEVLREIARHKLRYTQIMATTRYTSYSMTKEHKQSFVNGLKTLFRLVRSS